MAAWEYDRDVKWHTLDVRCPQCGGSGSVDACQGYTASACPTCGGTGTSNGDAFVFVYKTEGGEYVVSAMREGDASGGEIEYCQSLRAAKKFGEKIAADGSYVDYLTSEVE